APDPWLARAGDEGARIRADPHRAELQDAERPGPEPAARLATEDRPGSAAAHGQCDRGQQGAQHQDEHTCRHGFEAPLELVVPHSCPRIRHATANLRLRACCAVARTAAITRSTSASLIPGKI